MEELIQFLGTLGPWGVAAGAVLAAVLYYLRSRRPDLIPPPLQPKPDPNAPKPVPPLEERFPILWPFLKRLLGIRGVGDLRPEQVEAIRVELDELAEVLASESEEKAKAFACLKPKPKG